MRLARLFGAVVLFLLATGQAVRSDASELEEPEWLAGAILRQSEVLHLSAEQRGQVEQILRRAQSTWRALTERMAAAERDASASGRSDWSALAQERGRLRVLADRDALRVLDPEQRVRWRELRARREQ
ncbi:hypothetical protein HRbin30_00880 [bacterium HR30]|nr:hypothetical protein HRbin30_00880 [bacterium HR30]